jgi:hypothetical protein
MGRTIGVLEFDSQWGLGIFLFTTMSRTVLESTQPPIQLAPETLSLGVKWLGREADHSLYLVPRSKNVWSYTSTLQMPSWHGDQLKRSTGTTLLYL